MEIITNSGSDANLRYEGYTYTKKCTNKSTIRWECSQHRGQLYKVALVTDMKVHIILIMFRMMIQDVLSRLMFLV